MRYINIFDYSDARYPFQFFIGGRGTGKTYSALSGLFDGQITGRLLFMRRTAEEQEILCDTEQGEGANPFKPLNVAKGQNVGMKKISKKLVGIYNRTDSDGSFEYSGAPLGYGIALSTITGLRGVDFSDCTDLIYDEFIPEKHVRKMKGECDALLNAYETCNRNRELEGLPALRFWGLANANDIYNPIFVGLGIVSDIEKMLRRGKKDFYDLERGLAVHLLDPAAEYVEAKKNTALYKLTKGTAFYDMALSNDFAYNDFSLIEYRKLSGYAPICTFGDATLYRKKGQREIYISYAAAKCEQFNPALEQDVIAFKQKYGAMLMDLYARSALIFESYEIKAQILDLFYR